jgi:hypothetical protein
VDALLLWSGEGTDYKGFVWGRAPVNGAAFTLNLAAPPPAEAMTSYGFGMARLLIISRSLQLTEGRQFERVKNDLLKRALGASERHMIFFLDRERANAWIDAMADAGATPESLARSRESWIFDFPDGYACGVGRTDADGYAPADCREVRIRLGSLDDFEFPDFK